MVTSVTADSYFADVMLVSVTTHFVLIILAAFTSFSLVEVTVKLMAPDREQAETQALSVTGKGGCTKRLRLQQNPISLISVAHSQQPDFLSFRTKAKML